MSYIHQQTLLRGVVEHNGLRMGTCTRYPLYSNHPSDLPYAKCAASSMYNRAIEVYGLII